jgi:hypothetical protein
LPGLLDHLAWLIADLVVAVLIVIADALDGTGFFVGGFPFTSVLVWGYAYGIPGGLGSARYEVATGSSTPGRDRTARSRDRSKLVSANSYPVASSR